MQNYKQNNISLAATRIQNNEVHSFFYSQGVNVPFTETQLVSTLLHKQKCTVLCIELSFWHFLTDPATFSKISVRLVSKLNVHNTQ